MLPPLSVTAMFDMWYAMPLIIAVSLVYSATRFEDTPSILWHACRTAVWVIAFMAIVFLALFLVSKQL